ncbi:hypothetical protein P154DRAFT_611592 [Amniculicola lignicola CBS 123094]|uniref:Uncharacterized protein n=1 Tax=Amniculicola lignicola CBS 123094 TaxID=1392246 RepID=A0A6A5WY78_9PLEO|nr:hypothetical protein P154DRAFT_611592 [Amniculicola lignicola CBS 123094]
MSQQAKRENIDAHERNQTVRVQAQHNPQERQNISSSNTESGTQSRLSEQLIFPSSFTPYAVGLEDLSPESRKIWENSVTIPNLAEPLPNIPVPQELEARELQQSYEDFPIGYGLSQFPLLPTPDSGFNMTQNDIDWMGHTTNPQILSKGQTPGFSAIPQTIDSGIETRSEFIAATYMKYQQPIDLQPGRTTGPQPIENAYPTSGAARQPERGQQNAHFDPEGHGGSQTSGPARPMMSQEPEFGQSKRSIRSSYPDFKTQEAQFQVIPQSPQQGPYKFPCSLGNHCTELEYLRCPGSSICQTCRARYPVLQLVEFGRSLDNWTVQNEAARLRGQVLMSHRQPDYRGGTKSEKFINGTFPCISLFAEYDNEPWRKYHPGPVAGDIHFINDGAGRFLAVTTVASLHFTSEPSVLQVLSPRNSMHQKARETWRICSEVIFCPSIKSAKAQAALLVKVFKTGPGAMACDMVYYIALLKPSRKRSSAIMRFVIIFSVA